MAGMGYDSKRAALISEHRAGQGQCARLRRLMTRVTRIELPSWNCPPVGLWLGVDCSVVVLKPGWI
jgi:hypothetical protein